METTLTLSVKWWNSLQPQAPIRPEHKSALLETAWEQICYQTSKAKESELITSGGLQDFIVMDDQDGEDGIAYTGNWWLNQKMAEMGV